MPTFLSQKMIAVAAIIMLSACSTVQYPVNEKPQPPYSLPLATAQGAVPTLHEIFSLTAAQQAEFLVYFHSPERQHLAANKRLYRFLENKVSGFNYLGENHTASEAYALNSGNCISLAVLTKALADLAGVKVKFQNIVSAPVYSIDHDVMLASDHIRSLLYNPALSSGEDPSFKGQSVVVIDYLPEFGSRLPGPVISDDTFVAMFYRNLAAEAMLAERYEHALVLIRKAIEYAPTYSASINLAAILHRRLSYPALAEQFYQYGLTVADNKIALISNFAVYKQSIGDREGAEALFQELTTLDERDPYQWYVLGKTASSQYRHHDAVSYFKKAVQQAPYIDKLQLELALAYFKNKQLVLAYQTLEQASKLAPSDKVQQRYYAKLEALKLYQLAQ